MTSIETAALALDMDVWSLDVALHDLARRPVEDIADALSPDALAEWIATLDTMRAKLEQAARAAA